MDATIGQTWKRKDGRLVRVGAREKRGTLWYVRLDPVGKGRSAWKWEEHLSWDLDRVEERSSKDGTA